MFCQGVVSSRKGLVRRMIYITDLFKSVAGQFPDSQAIKCAEEAITYGDLDNASNRVARYLKQEFSVSRGDAVGFFVKEKSISLLVCLLAVLKLGGSYLIISRKKSPVRSFGDFTVLDIGDNDRSFKKIVEISGNFSEAEIEKPVGASVEDKAYNVLTSGSTGQPKLVSISHANIIATFYSWEAVYKLTPEDVHLQMASAAFDVFTGDWIRALCTGGCLLLCDKEYLLKPRELLALIDSHYPTLGEFVPSTLRILMDYMEVNSRSLDSFRLVIVGSDIWYMHECERIKKLCMPNARIINSYGVSEATIDSTYFEFVEGYAHVDKNSVVPIGKPFPHVDIKVLDEKGYCASANEIGKLVIGGAGVSSYGYTGSNSGAGGFFIKNAKSFYNTNDLVEVLADGNILFLGRNEEQFNINGERLNFLHVESLLIKHPKINSALIVPRLTQSSQFLEAFLVLDEPVSKSELVSYLLSQSRIAIIPRNFYEIDEKVISGNGKDIRESSCYAGARKIEDDDAPYRDDTQAVISKIWQDYLGFMPISSEDVFSSVPGSSLEYVKIIAKVNEVFNVSLPVSSSFSTVGEMAQSVEQLAKMEVSE